VDGLDFYLFFFFFTSLLSLDRSPYSRTASSSEMRTKVGKHKANLRLFVRIDKKGEAAHRANSTFSASENQRSAKKASLLNEGNILCASIFTFR